jgi:hypothetical protein
MTSAAQLETLQQTNIADDLLIQFDSAQKVLIESIADLARATSRSSPDRLEYTNARLRISQAELARTAAFNSVCDFLRSLVAPDQWITVAGLRAADTGSRIHAAAHVAEWTNERIEADWPAYCLASKAMRMRTGETIQQARAVLCPLLDQISKSRVNEFPVADSRVVVRGF